MELSEKKTVLDDDASIYQKREEKTDRAKWKELNGFKEKWEHFKDYYLMKTVLWVCAIAFVGYMIYEMVAPEPERVLYVAILDTVVMNDEMQELQDGYGEYVSFDEESQDMVFDNTFQISNSLDASSAQKFTVHAYSGDIDILIAKESVLRQYAGVYLLPLSQQLPADLYEELSELYCYASPQEEDGTWGEEQPYGIYISDFVEGSPNYNEPIVLAICGNSGRVENAVAFVRYLLERGVQGTEITVK